MMDRLKMLRNPGESDEVRAIATAVAELERDLHGAVQDHYDVIGAEPAEDLAPTEERVEQLCRLVESQIGGDLWGYYVEEQAPESLKNPEKARKHAGKSRDEWQETVDRWADRLREQLGDDVEDVNNPDLADRYTQRQFGVDLLTFRDAVVNWSPGLTMQIAMRGRVDADIKRIERATEALENSDVETEADP